MQTRHATILSCVERHIFRDKIKSDAKFDEDILGHSRAIANGRCLVRRF